MRVLRSLLSVLYRIYCLFYTTVRGVARILERGEGGGQRLVWGTRPFTKEEGSGNIAIPVLESCSSGML